MFLLQVDAQMDGSLERTFESDKGIWTDPVQGRTWRDLRAVPGVCAVCSLSKYQCNSKKNPKKN